MKDNWIKVEDGLPESGKDVLCANKLENGKCYQFMGIYAHYKTVIIDDDDDGDNLDSDGDKGESYLKPGWYELTEQVSCEYDEVYIIRQCTHWQPLLEDPEK